jgi:hypothetical protein
MADDAIRLFSSPKGTLQVCRGSTLLAEAPYLGKPLFYSFLVADDPFEELKQSQGVANLILTLNGYDIENKTLKDGFNNLTYKTQMNNEYSNIITPANLLETIEKLLDTIVDIKDGSSVVCKTARRNVDAELVRLHGENPSVNYTASDIHYFYTYRRETKDVVPSMD